MDKTKEKIKNSILNNNEREMLELLESGFDPNFESGWPIRLAARQGSYSIVKQLMHYGANPHLLSAAGASTLQLAVFASLHWESDNNWSFLLSCCDSSQLADGAAVAIIFNNIAALQSILETGRCDTNVCTSLTGKTVQELAVGYKLQNLLTMSVSNSNLQDTTNTSPRIGRTSLRSAPAPQQNHRNLSPSVARFFNLTANQPSLTPPRNTMTPIFSLSPKTQ